jgi:putative tricarboxylic transport membrane protein
VHGSGHGGGEKVPAFFSSSPSSGQGVLIMTKDTTAGIVSVVLGVGYLIGTFRITVPEAADMIGPRVFPFMISAAMIACGLALIVKELRSTNRKPFSWRIAAERGIWLRILLTIAAGIVYGLVLDWLGYLIATFFFMMFVASIINLGRHLQNAIIAAAFSISTFVAFAVVLKLSLPRGILGGLLPF